MKLKEICSNLFNINAVTAKVLSGKISYAHQLISILIFYIYQRGLIFDIFEKSSRAEPYFSHPKYLGDLIFILGLLGVAWFLRKKGFFSLVNLYFSTFIPCQVWTWIIFFIYLNITIVINFFAVENLYGEPWPFFTALGYLIYNSFPFILLILAIRKVALQNSLESE